MFDYASGPLPAKRDEPASATDGARRRVLAVLGIGRRHKGLIAGCALAAAVLGFAAAKLLPPRYVATTQIYVDPGVLPGASREALAPGQDSTGFINYVESQGLIITSRVVLARVVADEKLDNDPEFTGASRLSFLFGAPRPSDSADAAVAALAPRLQVRRPERTFVIDLSFSDSDPEKAARLANAIAHAYIDTTTAQQADASRQTEASLASRIEVLRKRVRDAEKKVEDFRTANNLIGVTEQQLKDMNAQLTLAKIRADEARAQLGLIENARRGANIAAIAAQINSPSLAALRSQQAQAQQRLADLTAELGPRHPSVIDAGSRLRASDEAVTAELSRIAQSRRVDYERAVKLEDSLNRQLEALKTQSNENGQKSVELRDLEREAEAAKGVYDLFVTRSREAGDIQRIEPPRTRIISLATPPKFRKFPPSGALLAGAGLAAGAGLGFLLAVFRERGSGESEPAPESERASGARPGAAPRPITLRITARSRLQVRQWRRSGRLELTGLGFPVLQEEADTSEFDAVLDALGLKPDDNSRPLVKVAIVGRNETEFRTSFAINLALCAAKRGLRPALIDASEKAAKLTRAIRRAMQPPDQAVLRRAAEGVLVASPKSFDAEIGRVSAPELLQTIPRLRHDAINLVICDGPDPDEPGASQIIALVDEVVAFTTTNESEPDEELRTVLLRGDAAPRISVQFDAPQASAQEVA